MTTSVLERFLRYVRIDTRSDERSRTVPTTSGQLVLLRLLVEELRAMGLSDAAMDEHGYVMATVPATAGLAAVPVVGLLAHVDTSPEMPGHDVRPIVHERYDGRDIVLPDDPSAVLRAAENPALTARIGDDIVTASGLTLLGADDKAGVAAIMAAVEMLMTHPEIPHAPSVSGSHRTRRLDAAPIISTSPRSALCAPIRSMAVQPASSNTRASRPTPSL
jgi:tripeptide aminopeptidase